MRVICLVLSGIGTLLFGALFLYIQSDPAGFDKRIRDFALERVVSKVEGTLQNSSTDKAFSVAEDAAGMFSDRLKGRVEEMRSALDAGLPEFVANVIATACELDCERKGEVEEAVRDFYESKIARYGVGIDTLNELVIGEYERVSNELRTDLSIFSLSNFVALFFAFLLAIFRGKAAAHLAPISILLTLSTLTACLWYVFGQDWVLTIIYSQYWGIGYSIFLAVVFASLLDIAFFKARVTSFVLNGITNALGAAVQFVPC